MNIKTIRRPWERKTKGHGNRYNPDPFYRSTIWGKTKAAFKLGFTPSTKGPVPNKYCYDCYLEGKRTDVHTIDHHVPIKEGGSRTDHSNLRSQCAHHHAVKSAIEGNQRRKKKL